MMNLEAQSWLGQVGARVLYHPESGDSERAWAAVIRTPATAGRRAQIILAFGSSLTDLAETAEQHWNEVWVRASGAH